MASPGGDDPDPLPPPETDPTTTTGSTTGEAPGSSTSGGTAAESTSVELEFCGNGVVDPGEECDDGVNNSDFSACTHQCKSAVCGDGLHWKGAEDCDWGPGNSKEYGGCTPDCQWASYCGDGVHDVGFEECDHGDLNGTGVGGEDGAPCDATCHWQGRLVFVTSALYDGNLGGLWGADHACRTLAEAAGLADATTFRAWLSDGLQSPLTRFEQIDLEDAPYILLNGRIVAESFGELVTEGPRTGISITEQGEAVFMMLVWTNTAMGGQVYSAMNHCADWATSNPQLVTRLGRNALAVEEGPEWQLWRANRHFTTFYTSPCNELARLYCFEDGDPDG